MSACGDLSQSRSLLTKTSHRLRPRNSSALTPAINSELEISDDDGLGAQSFCVSWPVRRSILIGRATHSDSCNMEREDD